MIIYLNFIKIILRMQSKMLELLIKIIFLNKILINVRYV